MITKTFKVLDMHCSNCPMHLQALEDDLAGVLEVDASYQKQQMTVKFDETLVKVEDIIAAAKALGYTAEAQL